MTATVTQGGHSGDTLSIASTQFISVDGNTVMFDSDGTGAALAVALGTLTSNSNTLTVALNGNATDAAVKALAEAIQFQNTLSTPAYRRPDGDLHAQRRRRHHQWRPRLHPLRCVR